MFSRVKKLVKNNWKKVVVGGVAVQVLVYGARYAANRFVEYHEARALELWKKMKKQQHFESMEGTYFTTYVSLLPALKETILECLDADALTDLLKSGIPNKVEVWEELKIIGFTRVIVTIYGSSLLNILIRIQLSVIGGYLFQESGAGEKSHTLRNVNGIILSNVTDIDMELQSKYLALANYLVKGGVEKLSEHIYKKTKHVVGPLSLKQKITISDLEQIFLNIVSAVNRDVSTEAGSSAGVETAGSPVKYPWRYAYPTDILQAHDYFRNTTQKCRPHYEPPDMYERLMCETFDLLDSDDVSGLLNSFESQGISHFCDRVADYVTQSYPPASENGGLGEGTANGSLPSVPISTDHHHVFSEIEVPVAKMIPMLNGLIANGVKESDPWIALLTRSESVRTLGANVYESFSNSSTE